MNFFLLITIILYLIFISPPILAVQSCDTCHFIIHNEIEPELAVLAAFNFEDETLVLLFKPIDPSGNSSICMEPRIELRFVHKNGAIEASKLGYLIPEINFCPGGDGFYPFNIKQLSDSILMTYVNPTSEVVYALILDKKGKAISNNTFIAPVPIINGNLYTSGTLTTHARQNGFLFTYYETETTVSWISFSIDDEKQINKINNGTVNVKNPFDQYFISPGIDGNFAFISTSTAQFPYNSPNSFTLEVFITYIRPNTNNIYGPFIIHQSTVPNLSIKNIICDTDKSDKYFCILVINEKINDINRRYLLEISFLYPSSIISTENFYGVEHIDFNNNTLLALKKLMYGGILVGIIRNRIYEGVLLDDNGDYYITWNLPENTKAPFDYKVVESKNGTMSMIASKDEYSWSIVSSPLEKSTSYEYGIPEVVSTQPTIDSTIPLGLKTISITYELPVMISIKNISIYQNVNGMHVLKQSVPGNHRINATYSTDSKTITYDVLSSTFNQPNTDYFVVVDDNAVENKDTSQPLLGIGEGYWRFKTGDFKYEFVDNEVGKFALNLEGIKYYQQLTPEEQSNYLSELRLDIASLIPIDPSRLDDIKKSKITETQAFFTIKVKSVGNEKEKNVDDIINDLDTLIRNKEYTRVSWLNNTKYLDTSYGFQMEKNFLDEFKFHFIGACIGVFVLSIIYCLARKRNPKGNNFAIFKLTLIIFDFIMDNLFIYINGKNVPKLYMPSIIFTYVPMGFFGISGLFIMFLEILNNSNSYDWFMVNAGIAAPITLLGGTDIEALSLLYSKFAGIRYFQAPISNRTKNYIFWLSCFGVIIEDIPQFYIQVTYELSVANREIIPTITLFTSFCVLLNNIVSKLYFAVMYILSIIRERRTQNVPAKIPFVPVTSNKRSDSVTSCSSSSSETLNSSLMTSSDSVASVTSSDSVTLNDVPQ